MKECPNCGRKDYTGCGKPCGCTWDEQIAAARIKERERRKELERQGRPVIVDWQRSF